MVCSWREEAAPSCGASFPEREVASHAGPPRGRDASLQSRRSQFHWSVSEPGQGEPELGGVCSLGQRETVPFLLVRSCVTGMGSVTKRESLGRGLSTCVLGRAKDLPLQELGDHENRGPRGQATPASWHSPLCGSEWGLSGPCRAPAPFPADRGSEAPGTQNGGMWRREWEYGGNCPTMPPRCELQQPLTGEARGALKAMARKGKTGPSSTPH